MLDYCMCPKCERMIMLDSDFETGFCLYCGTHISYQDSREFLLEGLKSAVPDDMKIEADLSELIDEDDAYTDVYGTDECRMECSKAQEYMGKWDFANAFKHYTAALEWLPKDFEACCGKLTAGILKLNDVENWESYLRDCTALIRSQPDWNMAQKSLEYSLDILKRFLSKGGRFVSPAYTYGFFKELCDSFPALRTQAAVILAHCVNVDNAPYTDECRMECSKAQEYMGKWDFANAFKHYTAALEWLPKDFEACCGKLTAGILKLNDVENWESYLRDCTALIRSQPDWNMAQKSLEYSLDILKRFLSKGGRFVSPAYTYGFFKELCDSFPALRTQAAVILAHCVNVDNAPYTDAARLDHETSRFAVGSYPPEPDKNLARHLLLIMKYHPDERAKHTLIRAVYVYDRAVWLRNHDNARIDDVLDFLEQMFSGSYSTEDRKAALDAGCDLLLMRALEPASTQREKLMFLTGVYSFGQIRRMERFFSGSAFFNRLYLEIYLKQPGASPISSEYRRIEEKLKTLS